MLRVKPQQTRRASSGIATALLGGMALLSATAVTATASAQECRRTCLVGEVRDANGCCGAAQAPPPTVRCPAGTTWNEQQRACIGRRVCPSGSHPEGSRCVADAVACPPGTERRDGQCMSQITCPEGSRLDGNRCVTDVTCPSGTVLTNGACVSQDVTCPAGTTRRPEGGCVATPTCPPNTQFVEGRGCVAPLVCPPLHHVDGDHCAPDHVCVEGEQWIEGQCRSVCSAITHSRWDGERRSCVCDAGFRAESGQCVASVVQTNRCPEGSHVEGASCVADVVCPDGYRYQANRGCIDPTLEARVAAERATQAEEERLRRAQLAREEAERRATRWGHGPGVQLSAGGGYQFVYFPNAYVAGFAMTTTDSNRAIHTGQAAYNNGVVSGAATLIAGDLSLSAIYTYGSGNTWASGHTTDPRPCPDPSQMTGSVTRSDAGWCITTAPMHLAVLDVGQQGVSDRHAWRVGLGVGWEFSGGALATQLSYRSTIRLVAGLFVAIDVRGLFLLRLLTNDPAAAGSLGNREVSQVPSGWDRQMSTMPMGGGINTVVAASPPFGIGGQAVVSLGYSIH
jgi:hypothetical protein